MMPRAFRAPTMLTALEAVQRELGAEALVVSARHVPGGPAWQVWKQPMVEVVAMEGVKAGGGKRKSEEAEAYTDPSPLASDLPPLSTLPLALADAYHHLIDQGVDEELVRRAVTACAETLNPRALEDAARVRDHLRRELETILIDSKNQAARNQALPIRRSILVPRHPSDPAQIICLIGLSGCGKTTTTAKLAAYYTKRLGLKTVWVCADTIRAGAIAQARSYAETLRLPLSVAYTPDELVQAVAAESDADLILVDTPGYNPRRETELIELGALLAALPERTTFLVASATTKEAGLNDALAAFGAFNLSGLVITKLDETGAFGNVFNAACRSQLPLAYFATGPRVLEDLQPARAGRLVGALFGDDWTP